MSPIILPGRLFLFFLAGCVFLFLGSHMYSQNQQDIRNILKETKGDELKRFSGELQLNSKTGRAKANELALKKGWMIRKAWDDGSCAELSEIGRNGIPVYFSTANLNAARTVSTNKVWSGGGAGLSLSGAGITLREWDVSGVRLTHRELNGRVTQGDAGTFFFLHSTHIAGTLLATGIDNNAHGMANQALLRAFDWNDDYAEMAAEAADGALISNSSYVYITGWYQVDTTWYWYGDTTISPVEDYEFGFYSSYTATVDSITSLAPYYLPCQAAGNERQTGPPVQPVWHYVFDGSNWVLSHAVRNLDGMPSGFDCIPYGWGAGKNVLTVGAVNDIPNGYSAPSDINPVYYSGTGPTDDGRIKPDIVANGMNLYSAASVNDSAYRLMSGTSMATPNAAGSLALLQEHYHNLHGVYMRAATLKGLVIHTADEAGINPGPDYQFGWGLLNTAKAAAVIGNSATALIREETLPEGATYTRNIKSVGTEPLRATICWTDPPGIPAPASLNPTDIMLVNDLDLRIDGSTYKPWVLNPANPTSAVTTGDNIRDNAEQVFIANPGSGCHNLTVTHKGSLSGGSQSFSLIISGISVFPVFQPGSVSSDQDICFNDVPALLTGTVPAGGSAPYSFQWQSSPDSMVFSNIIGATGINYQPGPLAATTYFRIMQFAQASCDTAVTNIVRIRVNPLPSMPGSISGPAFAARGQTDVVYSVPPVGNASGYVWNVPPGAIVTDGENTDTVIVSFSLLAESGNISVHGTNDCGNGPYASRNVDIVNRELHLTSLMLEGLYDGDGIMRKAGDESGEHFGSDTADVILVEVHKASDYASVKFSAEKIGLTVSGNATVILPGIFDKWYYVAIKHRNSIETVTADSLSLNGASISCSFDGPEKAYANNMGLMTDGTAVIYTGDPNRDGIVDGSDLSDMGNLANLAAVGYIPEDLTGDGLVDGSDLSIAENNSALAVGVTTP